MSKKKREPSREAALRRELENPSPIRAPATTNAAVAAEESTASTLARTYLPESILVTLLCLTPVSIPAIYYGLQVRKASEAGDQQQAIAASELARIWFILAVGFGATANIALLGAYLISQKT